ncbi:MAG: hypothetical protein PHQ72_03575 [Hespellia sp.]|nr:hypothetical protein [Hespellia sp.]
MKKTLMIKDTPVLEIDENLQCKILDFDRLPFSLRKETVTGEDYYNWAANRILPIDRIYAKEILNAYGLSQSSHYDVFLKCRGFSLTDSYWIREADDVITWEKRNLFKNAISLSIVETSLSGRTNVHSIPLNESRKRITEPTPELTTLGVNAKAWIRENEILYLHKVGKNEIAANDILNALDFTHIEYKLSTDEQISKYISAERKGWLDGVGEKIVHSKIFTSEDKSFVPFEEIEKFCSFYNMDPIDVAIQISAQKYHEMQVADYILNNSDRHTQNWGFIMDNESGKLIDLCDLFDHDRAFHLSENLRSQTSYEESLEKSAVKSTGIIRPDFKKMNAMDKPELMTDQQWDMVKKHVAILQDALETTSQ